MNTNGTISAPCKNVNTVPENLLEYSLMTQYPTPSEMMRAKRPYLYSDSANTDAYRLSQSELSHHLDTLTDRNQHKDFENFARKICEREICPNLRPQTGPEGGGDGKVDTETYPVDELISERWFMGDKANGTGKLAFAVSAKKDWPSKVRSDVKGIVGTKRGYDKIYFVTSRPARQKDRLDIEDELRTTYGVPVTILDREWIIDKVFSHQHKDIAFEQLGVGEHDSSSLKLGPNDFKNQQALDEIEERLARMGSSRAEYTQAVSDTYDAATLSRRLEKPKYETDGRFQRAIDFAKKYGADYQHLRAMYEHAWTRFWWYDDVEGTLDLYERVEELAFATNHAKHISRVCNLLQLVFGRVLQGHESAEALNLTDRSGRLKAKLTELAQDKTRPNNALHSETLLLLHQLNESALRGESSFDDVWDDLSDIVGRAEGLGEYPADLLDSVLEVLSPLGADSKALDRLVEKLAEFMAERSKELEAGRFYLERGERKLDAKKPLEAIKFLGRAVVNFMKDESKEEQFRALYCLAVGYRGAGLLWAARGAAMGAVAQVCAIAETDGEIPAASIPTFNLFTMIALQLGHVTDFLCGIQFLNAARQTLPLDDDSSERLSAKLLEFDQLCACLFTAISDDEINRLTSCPDILEELHLFTARTTLLYRLGYLELLKSDGSIPDGTSDNDVHEMMSMISAQPATRDLPKQIVLLDDKHDRLETKIMGINVQVSSSANVEGFLLAEAHISFAEAFFSTLLNSGAYPHRENLKVDIRQNESANEGSIQFKGASGALSVLLPQSWDPTEVEHHEELNDHLVAFGCEILVNCFALPDHDETLKTLIGVERGFERATLFCRTGITRHRFLGSHVGRVAEWAYMIMRPYALQDDAPQISPTLLPDEQTDAEKDAVPLGELNSHRDMSVSSIINQSLWNNAGWRGMMFGYSAPDQPPFLGLIFDNAEMAKAIFDEWQDRFGRSDENDEIRISVIKGIDRKNPFHYRGSISRDMEAVAKDDFRQFVSISRMTTMTVTDHRNVDAFSGAYASTGCYFLLPALLNENGEPELLTERAILKRKFHVRNAWEIGRHDLDSMAVTPKDDVIIPEGETNPPVHDLFEWRREVEAQRGKKK
ncbi:hypothetical protein [Chelativorans sp. Marseille-P2723]|uniref:hypothetical protein n=1 Tax=Chelativorans sp. Marseille-P2723 TaxID=2709133 RepID=UPI00156EB237|nr:hypothetical protein [Chelativorans sp. Marseille-P2723]